MSPSPRLKHAFTPPSNHYDHHSSISTNGDPTTIAVIYKEVLGEDYTTPEEVRYLLSAQTRSLQTSIVQVLIRIRLKSFGRPQPGAF